MTHQDPKSELLTARKYHAHLRDQLVKVEAKLESLGQYDSKRVPLGAHARDLESESSKLDIRIQELEQVVAEAEATLRTAIAARLPDVSDALRTLSAALDTCAEAERVVEQHRLSLREARLPSFKELPALVPPYAKKLVEQSLRELEEIQ